MEQETYYVIRDLGQFGLWDAHEGRFRGPAFAYKVSVNANLEYDEEFQKARAYSRVVCNFDKKIRESRKRNIL